eukprot:CAMPEP_0204532574 /NCGR_PEP_ID=MMETSP0661-20131031/11802_1 /ASSEMBLY_ACC=CAM_ASM_000606 /TAXON_ID=109239 /ORGANISM="Alexandrium margalefi, Strain AMGDE01CS-322" /LENGTH=251 /DNA_ID=CAMNT_0051538831 /DNA_START=83 /DNA_END=835 /DNA_ORIENTATION=-
MSTAVLSQAGFAAPVTTVLPATSPTVAMPTMTQAAPVTTYVQAAPAPVMQATPLPTPTYMYAAGSAEVPVYGSSVAVPQLYQQPAAALPTVSYQQSQPMTQEQLKAIFPMGAPSASVFQPFSQPQYQYNFVDSTSAFVPASMAGVPAAAPMATVPAASAAQSPVGATAAVSTEAPVAGSSTTATAATTAGTTSTETDASSKKTSGKKTSSSKKLSSKKKSKAAAKLRGPRGGRHSWLLHRCVARRSTAQHG